LEEFGPYLRAPHSKKITDKLYELRIVGENSIRILYTFYNNKYYLLHAFKKKVNKIPKKEIKIALDRIKEII
jgi:phage-related protein